MHSKLIHILTESWANVFFQMSLNGEEGPIKVISTGHLDRINDVIGFDSHPNDEITVEISADNDTMQAMVHIELPFTMRAEEEEIHKVVNRMNLGAGSYRFHFSEEQKKLVCSTEISYVGSYLSEESPIQRYPTFEERLFGNILISMLSDCESWLDKVKLLEQESMSARNILQL